MISRDLVKLLDSIIESKLPIFIWGSPGIGKSSIVRQVADSKELDFIDLRLSLLDPTDLKGIPFYDKEANEAVWASPDFLPKDKDSSGVLFLDEINSAPPSVQAAAYSLILDRKIGNYELPKNWAIVAAGNLESDRGVVYRLPTPLANRFVHINLEVDFNSWKEWAYRSDIDFSIIAFLQYDSDKLFNFDATLNEKAFATPRSWEYVDKLVKSNLDNSLLLESISGAIGKDVALEFIAYRKIMDNLPNIDDILENKEVEFEVNSQVLIALIAGIVSKAKRATKEQLENIVEFAFKLPSEFSIMLIKDLQQNEIDIESLDNFDKWANEYSELLV